MKIYCALVWGKTPSRGTINLPLAHDPSDRRRMRAISAAGRRGERVWEAITRYRRVEQAHGVSLLKVEMKTGVTHQIRAHFAALGHPIVGDALYGNARSRQFGLARHFLHAHKLGIVHPDTKKPLTMIADLPKELTAVLQALDMEH
jgi:23S rRNA pseudouridine1911/1915/1917 synthase